MENRNKNKLVTFDLVYYPDVVEQTIMVFEDTQDMFPNIDFKWAITNYMKSDWRKKIEDGNPREIGEWGDVVLIYLFKDKDYPKTNMKSDDWWLRLTWMAEVYNRISYRYDIPFSKLIDVVSFDYMMWRFVCGHEESLEHVTDAIYNQFYFKDGSINTKALDELLIEENWWVEK